MRDRASGPRRSVGTSPARPDGAGKVTGRSIYVDDLAPPGAWHGATVRSPHASARIAAIDTAPARAADPEVRVLTAADLPGPNHLRVIEDDWPVLAAERVAHVGEPVALVAAPTRARARAAAARVRVEYEELPAVLGLDEALRGEPKVLAQLSISNGDLERGFARADVVVEGVYETGLQEHAYVETNGMIAFPGPGGALEVAGSMQCPYYVHEALLEVFGLRPDELRVRQTTTGGGFGGKEEFPDAIAAHAALLARAVGRPVKIVYDRHEDIVGTTKRHPSRVRHRTGLLRDGTLVAQEIELLLDGGAYVTLSPVVLSRAALHAGGPYRCPNVSIRGRVVATNTPPNGAFRGFGAPQAQFAAERHMDRIGRALGIDPLSLRERNAYRPGDETPTGQVLAESVSALECLRIAAERTDFLRRWRAGEEHRRRPADDGAPLRGIGLSLFWHGAGFTGNGERRMRSPVRLSTGADGTVEVRVSSTDFGQGTSVVLAQIVADALGIDGADVAVVDPDTAEVPDSGPTVASRTVMVVGGTLERAARSLARELAAFAADSAGLGPGEARLEDGRFAADGRDLGSLRDVVRRRAAIHGPLVVEERFEGDASTFDEETYRGTAYSAYGWGCDVVEIEVDPDTLATRPTRVTAVCDVGKAVHPVLCAGQIEGGTLQAIALGYLEEVKTERGRYLNDRLQTYVIPTTLDTPEMDTVLVENPAPGGPHGAKGVGELPADGGAAAVVAAIENATGIAACSAPATPERLLADLAAGRVVDGALELRAGDLAGQVAEGAA